ncbi:MAG: HTTM domain-containing protein [Myxococcota bacterium]
MSVARRIDRFLFAPVDAWSVGVFRVALVLVVALAFWEDRALPGFLARTHWAPGLWDAVFRTPAWWAACLLALAAVGAGVGGRLGFVAAFGLLLPLAFARSAASRQILLTVWVCAGLLGARPAQGALPIWPIRLVQLQLSTVYAVNVWAKLTPEFLRGDVLVGLSRAMPNFRVDLSEGHLALGPLAVPVWLCAVGTVAVEAALAVGFWLPRLRWATAALGVTFHLGLKLVLTIGWLDWTCMLLYLAFLLPFERPAPGADRR